MFRKNEPITFNMCSKPTEPKISSLTSTPVLNYLSPYIFYWTPYMLICDLAKGYDWQWQTPTRTTRWTCRPSSNTCCSCSTSARPRGPKRHGQWTGSGVDGRLSVSGEKVKIVRFLCKYMSSFGVSIPFALARVLVDLLCRGKTEWWVICETLYLLLFS